MPATLKSRKIAKVVTIFLSRTKSVLATRVRKIASKINRVPVSQLVELIGPPCGTGRGFDPWTDGQSGS